MNEFNVQNLILTSFKHSFGASEFYLNSHLIVKEMFENTTFIVVVDLFYKLFPLIFW